MADEKSHTRVSRRLFATSRSEMEYKMKKILRPEIARKITGVIFGLAGLAILFIFVMVSKEVATASNDPMQTTISADEQAIVSMLLTGSALFGILTLFYAYLRLFAEAKNYIVRLFYKRKIYIVLYGIVAAFNIAWIVSTLMPRTIIPRPLLIVLSVPLAFAILLDGYLYVKMLIDWLKGK